MAKRDELDLIDDAILDFIASYREKNGMSPTAKEVGKRVRLSYEAANNRINNLIRLGKLMGLETKKGRRVARSIRILDNGN